MKPSASQVEQIIKDIKAAKEKAPYLVSTRAYYDSTDIFDEGKIQRIHIESRYLPEEFEDNLISNGDNEINWIEKGVQLSKAVIWRINKRGLSFENLYIVADGAAGDFESAAAFMMEFFKWDSPLEDEIEGFDNIYSADTWFYFEEFEVNKEFRGNGLGRYLAGESLRIAGARGLPFFVFPDTTDGNKEVNNDPERLKQFWMTVQDKMFWCEEHNLAYSEEFEADYGEYEV